MTALSDLVGEALIAAITAIIFFLTARFLGDNATWVLYLLFFVARVRPSRPTFSMWITVSVIMSLLDASAYEIMAFCSFIDACMTRDYITLVCFVGTTIALGRVSQLGPERDSSDFSYTEEEVQTNHTAPPGDAPTVNSVLLPLVQSVGLWILALVPRSILAPDDTSRGLPEERFGVIHAFLLQTVQLYFSHKAQYWLYAPQWFFGLSFSGSKIAAMEGLGINLIAWYFGYSPTVACVVYLTTNVLIHPLRQRSMNGGGATPVLQSQVYGLTWFIITALAFTVLSMCFGSVFKSVLAVIILLGCLVVLVSVVGPQIYIAYHHRQKPRLPLHETRDDIGINRYKYEALPTSPTIRLLRILPALSNRNPIQCELVYGSFEGDVFAGPTYTGISYRWDPPRSKKVLIYINGKPFEVFPTVHAILRALRAPFRYQCVWIDSVCINQDDDIEKASQVQFMRLIYENCSYVVGWVNGDDEDPGNVFEMSWKSCIDLWTGYKSSSYLASLMLGRINSSKYLQHVAPDEPPSNFFIQHPVEYWKALEKLVTNSYFTRIWIVQEIVASRNVILYYSGQPILWETYARAMTVISSHGLRNFVHFIRGANADFRQIDLPGIDNALVMENLRLWYGRHSVILPSQRQRLLPLEDTLKLCLRFESSWDVDRIYALLGLISDREELNIVPNYEAGQTHAVFSSLARSLLQGSDPFRTLRFAGVGQSRRLEESPSWVPDWTAKLETCVLSHTHARFNYRATRDSTPNVHFTERTTELRCPGTVVDQITLLSQKFSGHPPKGLRQFHDALELVQKHIGMEYPTGQTSVQAFWRTLIGDMDPRVRPASQSFINSWQTVIRDFEVGPDPSNDADQDRLEAYDDASIVYELNDTEDNRYSHILSTDLSHAHPGHHSGFTSILGPPLTRHPFVQYPLFAFGRRLCITDNGYIGLVPGKSERGDKICLLRGSKTPHVLRLHDKADAQLAKEHYQLVGECYIHGIMDGEAFDENMTSTIILR